MEIVKEQINDNVNAEVKFADFNLSIFKSFPSLTVTLDDLSVVGVDKFEGDTLAALNQLYADLDIMSVISGDEIQVKSVVIDRPIINGKVLADSSANWDIAKPSDEEETEEETSEESSGEFKLGLELFEIKNAYISYHDVPMNVYADIDNLNYTLEGDMTADFSSLAMKLNIDSITTIFENVTYLKKATVAFDAGIDADLKNMKYTFTENTFALNKLNFGFDGWVHMKENDDIDLDMKFNAKEANFKDVLSLIPAIFMEGYEGLQTKGNFVFATEAKGTFNAETEQYPAFDFTMNVKDAMFKYPDLPGKADAIAIDLKVNKPDGDLDLMVVDLSKFHIEFENNPFDMSLLLKKPMSDPDIKAAFKGMIDLDKMKNIIPLEDTKLTGKITSDLEFEGLLSMIEEERYEEFKALGNLGIENMLYEAEDMPSVIIEKTEMAFSPQFVELSAFDTKVGKSDFHLTGRMENFIPYALSDGILKGEFTYSSDLIDSNEFLEEEEEEVAEAETTAEDSVYEVAEIPKNIDFVLNTTIGKIIYDKMEIDNTVGSIVVRGGKADLSGLEMDLLGGHMKMDGFYSTINPSEPKVDLSMDIQNFSIQETYTSLSTVKEMAPFLENCYGNFDLTFAYQSLIDNEYSPVLNTVNGGGVAVSNEIEVKGSKLQNFLVEELKQSDYETISAKDQTIRFEIENGEVKLDTMYSQFSGNTAETYGITNLDQNIDYTIAMKIPRENLGSVGSDLMGSLGDLLGGTGVEVGDIILADVLVTGTVLEPKYGFKLKGTEGGSAKDAAKKKLEDEFNKRKEDAKKKLDAEKARLKREADKRKKEEEERLRKEAEKRKADLKKKADEEAARKKEEAEKKLQDEKDKLKDKTKNLFK